MSVNVFDDLPPVWSFFKFFDFPGQKRPFSGHKGPFVTKNLDFIENGEELSKRLTPSDRALHCGGFLCTSTFFLLFYDS